MKTVLDQTQKDLFDRFRPLAEKEARCFAARNRGLSRGEAVSVALLTLWNAATAYRSQRTFEKFCRTGIWWALLRELDKVRGGQYPGGQRHRRVSDAARDLEAELGRRPFSEEVAARMGIPHKRFCQHFGHYLGNHAQIVQNVDDIVDGSPGVAETEERRELREMLRAAIMRLPQNAQRLIDEHYECGRSFADIGDEHGVSRVAVHQAHGRALAALRKVFKAAQSARSAPETTGSPKIPR